MSRIYQRHSRFRPKKRSCLGTEMVFELRSCIDHHDSKLFMFKTGPILVFLWIHRFIRIAFSFRGSVYSHHKCCICCPSSESRKKKCCPCSASFKPVSENSLNNFWSSDNCSIFRSYSCTRLSRCCALAESSAKKRLVGIFILPNDQALQVSPEA